MTGFNVNCKDCDYCYPFMIDWNNEDKPKAIFRCGIFGSAVDFVNNIDCINFEPKRTTDDE